MFSRLIWVLVILTATASVAVWALQPTLRKLPGVTDCNSKTTCHDCIQTPDCAWCASVNFTNKCFQRNAHSTPEEACPKRYTIDPATNFTIVRNDLLTSAAKLGESIWERNSSYTKWAKSTYKSHSSSSSSSHEKLDAVQIQPQEINLKLRINEVYQMKFAYSQAEDYPVDLYYLMDLSMSMKDDKQKLSDLGVSLVETMRNMSSNFRLGFGSFVDKVAMPYVSTVPESLIRPCTDCESPYGYKHVMALSDNAEQFTNLVREASVSGNLDAPEGGFDALMQAVVCKDKIGWREKARRLLVFSTDAGFHYAGDGKLGGIIKPNDGVCHLNNEGLYTHSLELDYPSISQINYKVKENSVNVIWAVTYEQMGVYSSLANHVQGSSCQELSPSSTNIVELIKQQYQSITSSVEIKDTASKMIKVRYFSNCATDGPEIETSTCSKLKAGAIVTFTAHIQVERCPKDKKKWNEQFYIYPVGLQEKLAVNLEVLCDCDCEHGGNLYERNHVECRERGTLACGLCDCDDRYFGEKCQCDILEDSTSNANATACTSNGSTGLPCSGRGTCECGLCKCNKGFSGTHCECDDASCDRHNNLLCGGKGTCKCGKCICNEGFTGSKCDCTTSTETCRPPKDPGSELCSGNGKCVCGRCECFENKENPRSGPYCNKCSSCPIHCKKLKPCVECKMYSGKNDTAECNETCKNVEITPFEKVSADDDDDTLCYGKYDDCSYQFVYNSNSSEQFYVEAQEKVVCPPRIFVLGIVLGVMAAIVLIGLAFLLLWKLLTTIHDRREFARFEKERMMAKWDTGENPIYKQATSTFKNPTYAGK